MAIGFSGDPVPPGIAIGAAVSKKAQRFRAADVIGMRVTVNQVGNWSIARHPFDCLSNCRCVGLRCIDHDNPAIVNQKHRLY